MIEADRIISAAPKREEEVIDRAIRPKLLATMLASVVLPNPGGPKIKR